MAETSESKPSQPQYWRTPLDLDRIKIPHGEVTIITDRCKGCEFCVEYCPRGVLQMSRSFNRKGYHYPEVVKGGSCVDCNLCSMICPEFAIFAEASEPQTVTEAQAREEEGGGTPDGSQPARRQARPRRNPEEKTNEPRSVQ